MARQVAAAAQAAAEAEALRARQEVRVPPLLSKQMSFHKHCAPRIVMYCTLHQCTLFETGTLLAFVQVDACGSHCCVHFDPVRVPHVSRSLSLPLRPPSRRPCADSGRKRRQSGGGKRQRPRPEPRRRRRRYTLLTYRRLLLFAGALISHKGRAHLRVCWWPTLFCAVTRHQPPTSLTGEATGGGSQGRCSSCRGPAGAAAAGSGGGSSSSRR